MRCPECDEELKNIDVEVDVYENDAEITFSCMCGFESIQVITQKDIEETQ